MTKPPHSSFRWFLGGAVAAVALFQAPAPLRAQTGTEVLADIDLSTPFRTRSSWRFTAIQEKLPTDPKLAFDYSSSTLQVCLRQASSGACVGEMQATPPASDWGAQELGAAEVVYPHGPTGSPLLLVQTASNGVANQARYTQLFAYRRKTDKFVQIYGHTTGRNNNEEVRFVTSGPLMGDLISAEPTEHSPYDYWITVDHLTPAYSYSQVLRYRSATGYADGNMLAVIDSEMPNIEKRLGLWRPGQPLPTPARCPKPHLVHTELYCS